MEEAAQTATPKFAALMPDRIKALPRTASGYPVPFFVEWKDGIPDFRVMRPEAYLSAVKKKVCWTCGQPLGRVCAFVGGSLIAGQRKSAEPPSHRECAVFAARICPFLARPMANRREGGYAQPTAPLPGHMLEDNPGIAMVYLTRDYELKKTPTGPMFELGEPTEVLWFHAGQEANQSQVAAAIELALERLAPFAKTPAGDQHVQRVRQRLEALAERVPA